MWPVNLSRVCPDSMKSFFLMCHHLSTHTLHGGNGEYQCRPHRLAACTPTGGCTHSTPHFKFHPAKHFMQRFKQRREASSPWLCVTVDNREACFDISICLSAFRTTSQHVMLIGHMHWMLWCVAPAVWCLIMHSSYPVCFWCDGNPKQMSVFSSFFSLKKDWEVSLCQPKWIYSRCYR